MADGDCDLNKTLEGEEASSFCNGDVPSPKTTPTTTQPQPRQGGGGGGENGDLGGLGVEEIAEQTVGEVLASAAEVMKEHDAIEEEMTEARRIEEELAAELDANDGWLKILGNDELVKKVLVAGEKHRNPLRGDVCRIRVEGWLQNDPSNVFMTEHEQEIQLGDSEVIAGLDLSIPLMTVGETAEVRVSSRFGYGSLGDPPLLPPNTDIAFKVTLLEAQGEPELETLTVAERRRIGGNKRDRGNWWYRRGESSLSVNCYRRALEYLDEVEGGIQLPKEGGDRQEATPELKELFEERLKTLNNLAMAQLKLESYEPALNSVEAVLKCQPNNVKALFRKGKILGQKGETEKALNVLYLARGLEPEDKGIANEIVKLSGRRKKEAQSEKQLYKRMFTESPTKTGGGASEGNNKGNEKKNQNKKGLLTIGSFAFAVTGIAVAVAGVMAYRYKLF